MKYIMVIFVEGSEFLVRYDGKNHTITNINDKKILHIDINKLEGNESAEKIGNYVINQIRGLAEIEN